MGVRDGESEREKCWLEVVCGWRRLVGVNGR